MRELKQFVSVPARRKGAAECLLCRPGSDSKCRFSAFWLLSCLRSSSWGSSGRRGARFLALGHGFRGDLGFAAIFHFGAGTNLLLIRRLILHQRAFALADECQPHVFAVPVDT